MSEMQFCQSCAMPLKNDVLGTEKDGAPNHDYCSYCYKDGEFTAPIGMDEMIEVCIAPMLEANEGMTEEQARAGLKAFFPTLKRWKKA